MRKKYFYNNIIETVDISLSIAGIDMPNEERVKLIELAEQNIHHSVLDFLLLKLENSDKETLLSHMNSQDHAKTWEFLNRKMDNSSDEIEKLIRSVVNDLQNDIKEVFENGEKKKENENK